MLFTLSIYEFHMFLSLPFYLVHHWIRSQLHAVRYPEEMATVHEHQEHYSQAL